jgi:hypothetical protein
LQNHEGQRLKKVGKKIRAYYHKLNKIYTNLDKKAKLIANNRKITIFRPRPKAHLIEKKK